MGMTTGAGWWRRAARLLAAAAVLAALSSGQARADDDDGDDGGSAGGSAAGGAPGSGPSASGEGDGRSGGGRFDLGPNPGRIPMPPAWERRLERLFGASPPAQRGTAPARADLVVLGVGPEALASLRQQDFVVVASREAAGLARLRGPAGLGAVAALARLRGVAPGATAARNDRYRLAQEEAEASPDAATPPQHLAPPAICGDADGPLVALIDTGVDARHPELEGRIERQESLRGPGRRPARTAHGTAVALRLSGAAPGLRIAVLDAFHLGPDGEAADAFDVAAALARVAATGARLANVSFVGPANAVVERLGAEAAAAGVVFVAAAGNDGPRARPLYPAAYPWTVAVSAVDAQGRPWARSAAGPHIGFAAHGVELRLQPGAAAPTRRWSGTSFAAPLVTAAIAALPEAGPGIVERLATLARDAGAPGRDPVFGWGIVEPPSCAARIAAGG